jgi:hypothetical protein
MPFTYRIDTEDQVVYGRIWGEWSFEDVREFRKRAVADPDYQVGIRQFFDFTEATGFEMTVKEMLRMGSSVPKEMSGRRAYVVPDPANFGMLRAYQVTADKDDNSLQVCRSMDEARAWLGLD